MNTDKAEKQKQKAKEMLGISDNRAKEIFEEQPDRKQQKKKELEEKQETNESSDDSEDGVTTVYKCSECGDEFDSEQGVKAHKGQVH